jgi:DNA-binding transcriptional regulator YiaG
MAHCPNCHETFSTVAHFDNHRTGPVEKRRCIATRFFRKMFNLKQNAFGTWIGIDERDVTEWLKRK